MNLKKSIQKALLLTMGLVVLSGCDLTQVTEETDEAISQLESAVSDLRQKNEDLSETIETYQHRAANIEAAIKNWSTFRNSRDRYAVDYPADWQIYTGETVIGFSPPEMFSDYQWGIQVYDLDEFTINELVNDVGAQFMPNRDEIRNEITVGELEGIQVTITTSEIEDWFYQNIFLRSPVRNKLYRLSNGAIPTPDFQTFYESFELI